MALSAGLSGLCSRFLKLTLQQGYNGTRNTHARPRMRYPDWFLKKERLPTVDNITFDNRQFINETIQDKMRTVAVENEKACIQNSPLRGSTEECESIVASPESRRTGLIAKKIGVYPMWEKNGKRILATLLQVTDNQVVKYVPPEEWEPSRKPARRVVNKKGCLLVGAETVNPATLTKQYYGLFKSQGVLPKRYLCRFTITPDAALPPGTPLTVSHFRVGDVVDVRGNTIDRGFQGVMKRWNFSGMPATHGVTKTHRRPGNIGGGGEKGRVWPGTKMPGHMGNRWRILRGTMILRIDAEHGVLWVKGPAVAGGVGDMCYIYDTILPNRRPETPLPFPTHFADKEKLEITTHDSVHRFGDPTITFAEQS